MLDVATKMYPEAGHPWMTSIAKGVPSYGVELNENPSLARQSLSMTAKTLGLKA
jgi:hypothetical protein